jgi:hypothetical protein
LLTELPIPLLTELPPELPIPLPIELPISLPPQLPIRLQTQLATPLVYNDTIDTSNMTNVLLIDSNLTDNKELYDSVNANTFPIIYNYNCKTDDLLALFRQKFPASSIKRIAIMFHGREDSNFIASFINNKSLFEYSDLADNQTSFSENVSFLIKCIKEFHVENIDFLACNTLQHSNWKRYYALLGSQTSVLVGASNDATGNLQYGGDWVMESTGEDIKQIYFTDSIDYYKYLLAEYYSGGIYYTYTYNGLQNQPASVTRFDGGLPASVNILSSFYAASGFTLRNYIVTSIGNSAFQNATAMTSVSIPTSVTSIGYLAFYGCTGLTSVIIPNSVTSVGYSMFANCSNLTSATIGNAVTSISDYMFQYCTKLASVSIPNSVTSIGQQAFQSCALTSVSIPSSVTSIAIFAFYSCTALTSISIPNSVTSVGYSVFALCSNLTSATIGNALISDYMFQSCTKLASVTIGTSVASIGQNAFQSCALTSVSIPSSVTTIGNSAFQSCPALTSVIIPNSVTTLGSAAFNNCTALTSVTISNAVTTIQSSTFQSCSKLTSVIIPDSVTTIGTSAFLSCVALTSATIGSSVTSIGNSVFQSCTALTSVSIPNSVTSIGITAFQQCSALTSVTIGSSVASIGTNAFLSCVALTSVIIPNSVTSLGAGAFSSCSKLASVTIGTSVTSIGDQTFIGCSALTSVIIPNSVITIGSSVFYLCSKLTSATIGSSVTSIGGQAFSNCSKLTSVIIPNSVTSIGLGVFQYCTALTSATIGSSVASIGTQAFIGCSALTSIIIPNSVTSIGTQAFQNCTALTSATISNAVTSIQSSTFSGCSKLTSVIIPNSVTSIGSSAFSSCTALTSATIGSSVSTIGTSAFQNCTALTSISIPSSVTSIASSVFFGCFALTSFDVSLSNANYSNDTDGALFDKNKLVLIQYPVGNTRTTYTIPSSVTTIGFAAFYGSNKLTSVTIPNSVTIIGQQAFQSCTTLTSVIIPNSVTSLGPSAFSGCSALTSVIIPNALANIQTGTFSGCSKLASVTIPNSVGYIADVAFQSCVALTSITIPNSVGYIGNQVFQSCTALTSISIPNSVTNMGNQVFIYCSGLASATIGNGLTGIQYGTFFYCTNLTSVTIGRSVISIGQQAFYGCSKLASVIIPAAVTSIGSDAFRFCSALNLVYFLQTSTLPTIGSSAFGSIKTPSVARYYSTILNTSAIAPPIFTSISSMIISLTTMASLTGYITLFSTITYNDLVVNGNAQATNMPYVFLVRSITSGSLKIGANDVAALPWNASTNNTIDANNNAYWTPPAGVTGLTNAFMVVIQDSIGGVSTTNVQVRLNLGPPTLTKITPFNGAPDTLSTITYAGLVANGNQKVGGLFGSFVYLVKSISTATGSSLNIGTTQGSAQPWNATTNNTINLTNNAYWMPPTGATGLVSNAFMVVIRDAANTETTPPVAVPVNLSPPTLTTMASFTGTPNAVSLITYNNLNTNGNEVVFYNPYVYIVPSITTGSLMIGATEGAALPWNVSTNKTIDLSNNAYWTPSSTASGSTKAFMVAVQDAVESVSSPSVQVLVNLIPPTLTTMATFTGGTPNTTYTISYANLVKNGNQVVVKTPYVFVVRSISTATGSSLKIGATQLTALPWNVNTNSTINVINNAYWTPPTGVSGLGVNAFSVAVQDSVGNISSPNVPVLVDLTLPELTNVTPFIGTPNKLYPISYTALQTKGNEIVYSSPYVFLVQRVLNGSLKIGATPTSAQPWSQSNKIINNDPTNVKNAYWLPPSSATQQVNSFSVVVEDNLGNISSVLVPVPVILEAPILTLITPFTGTENTQRIITYTDLATNGNEVVVNTPFIYLVQVLSSGSLKIGATQETATSWSALNKTINANTNAYWTPETGVIGLANAFMVVIQDSNGTLSSPDVQVSVNLISETLPTLTSMTPFTGNQDTLVVISYTDLQTNGNEVVYNPPYVFLVNSVTRGLLSIGASQETATPWSLSNKTINTGNTAYWTPPKEASGSTNAFMVAVQDAVGNESSPNVQVEVILSAAPCFKKGTKILCENDMYIPIEKLKIGDLVKTYKHGYQKIIMSAQIMRVHNNSCDDIENRINQLYTYSCKKNPKLIEDLHLTGGHSLLLNKLTKDESNDMKQIPWTDDEFVVEDKYKLLACFSSKLCIATEQNVEIYHFTLEPPENAKPSYVYGIYANGILAESCSKGAMEEALGKK